MRTSQNYQQGKRTIQKGKSSSTKLVLFSHKSVDVPPHNPQKHPWLSVCQETHLIFWPWCLGDFYCESHEVIKATIFNLEYQLSQILWRFSPVVGEINEDVLATNQSHQTSGFGDEWLRNLPGLQTWHHLQQWRGQSATVGIFPWPQ